VIDYPALYEAIDFTVDPCTDFYRFACGNYLKRAVIADDKRAMGSFTDMQDVVEKRVVGK